MKNLFIGAFMLAFTAVATAQTDNTTQTTNPATPQQTTTTTPATAQPDATMQQPAATPAQQATAQPATTTPAQPATATAAVSEDYNKISQSQIAPAVLKEAVAKYKDYSLVQALVAEDGSNYKLVLTKDGKDVAAYYKKTGEFIREEAA
ncbi:hypothetical protein GR160_08530 [Flavobacterium sp. Sd200]|uniref:hypothetical protein n=1 Tax=Flavobacterium sp. Sd200 TaxID=2692211 RepID=UPI001369D48B|nr:hypothetical protein [Flavobacterium sp. Sd200]MXN91273.1 hypothetical protein [Flavobacterium sp. Sd200]